jgi:hypothetical protein
LKRNPPAPVAPAAPVFVPSKNFSLDITNMTKEQLAGKLITYQQFMSKYIVEAQEQKMKAVQAAEAAITAKYEQKLKLYQAKTPSIPEPSPATKLYQGRNANVAAAAVAGKSRWGDMEVSKVQGKNSYVNAVQVNGATVPIINQESDAAPITMLSGSSLYYHRNQMVAAAGAAGKSRWGDAEVGKAIREAAKGPLFSSSAPSQSEPASSEPPTVARIVVIPEIEAADHGLRSDGGVSGPSLAERVNLGEQLFAANGGTSTPAVNGVASATLYNSRNVRVAAAAAAGKSRWGTLENDKATKLSSVLLPAAASSAIAVAVPPEVAAADHGMRADGGVGGPSLAQRVNLGANLLAY